MTFCEPKKTKIEQIKEKAESVTNKMQDEFLKQVKECLTVVRERTPRTVLRRNISIKLDADSVTIDDHDKWPALPRKVAKTNDMIKELIKIIGEDEQLLKIERLLSVTIVFDVVNCKIQTLLERDSTRGQDEQANT